MRPYRNWTGPSGPLTGSRNSGAGRLSVIVVLVSSGAAFAPAAHDRDLVLSLVLGALDVKMRWVDDGAISPLAAF